MYNQIPYSTYNPGTYQGLTNPSGSGLLGLAKKPFSWNSFLDNTQRTLNVINQAMPIYNQVKPMFRNMGTIFKVIGELNSAPAAASSVASTVASTPQFFV